MESHTSRERLALLINEFAYQFALKQSDCTRQGALVQCWCPREAQGQRVLSTQNSPFAILGSSDQLALYKYVSSKYRPSCDGANAACAIGRVFANLQPELSQDASSQACTGFDRAAEAQRCGIHSTLLLPIYKEECDSSCMGEPVAVLELAMHELDVDFTKACATLQKVAMGHGFWIPCLQSARSTGTREVPLEEPLAASSSTSTSSSSMASPTAAPGCQAHKPRSCTPTPPCMLAAAARRQGRPVHRSSIHLAERGLQQPPGSNEGLPRAGQQAQQQQHKPCGRKLGKPVIITDYYGYGGAADAAAGRPSSSRGKQRSSELADPGRQQEQQQLAIPSSSSRSVAQSAPPGAEQQQCVRRSFEHAYSRLGGRSAGCGSNVRSLSSGNRQQGHQTFDPCAIAASLRRAATPPVESFISSRGRPEGFWGSFGSKLANTFGGTFGSSSSNSTSHQPQQQQQQQQDWGALAVERSIGSGSNRQVRHQQDFGLLAMESGAGSGSSRQQWQQPPPPPPPPPPQHPPQHQHDWGLHAVEHSAGSGSRLLSPFQCGAPESAPLRTLTPPRLPHRHIVEQGHAARSASASLQVQALLGGHKANLREQQQQHCQIQQQWDNHQQRDQQPQEQQQQQGLLHWQEQQQQQHNWQASSFAAAASSQPSASAGSSPTPSPDSRANSTPLLSIGVAKAGSSGSASSSQPGRERVRALVAHGGAFRHTGLGGMWAYVGGAQKLVGVPRHAGMKELQGQLGGHALSAAGQCKMKYALPSSPRAAGADPTYVDLESEEDVEIMWEEMEDYAATHKGTFRLQLYVESPEAAAAMAAAGSGGSSTAMADTALGSSSLSAFSAATSGPSGAATGSSAYASSDSGRASGGSDSSSGRLLLPGLGQGLRAPSSSGLQPEVVTKQGSGPAAHSRGSSVAQVSGLSLDSPHSGGVVAAAPVAKQAAAAAGIGCMLMQQQQQQQQHLQPLPEQQGATLVHFYGAQLGSAGAATSLAAGAGGVAGAAAGPGPQNLLLPPDAAPQQQLTTEYVGFLSCTDASSMAAAANFAAAGRVTAEPAAAAAEPAEVAAAAAAGVTAFGDASKCNSAGTAATGASSSASSISSTHSGRLGFGGSPAATMGDVMWQKQQQLKALVSELEGRVEVIMPQDLNIVRYLGGGAFGEVYLCRWHGVETAVKSLSPSLISADASGTPCADACADLLKEAAVLASLHHPNIVSVFGVVLPPWQLLSSCSRTSSCELPAGLQQQHGGMSHLEESGDATHELTDELLAAAAGTGSAATAGVSAGGAASSFSGCRAAMASALSQGHPPAPAIVTEFLSLGSLHSAISSRAEWLRGSMARAKLLLDTARGLDYLHSKRLVHFDLKSANLLVTMRDKVPCVKLADMGLTKQRRQTFVSGINSLRGTLPWIAPEIVKNPGSVTEKADIWSFGVCMWQLWTMQEPFEGVHLHALLHQLSAPGGLCLPAPGTPDWPEDQECPAEPAPGWRQLMQRCWQQPGDRPNARQLVAAVEEMMDALRAARRRTSDAASGQHQRQQQQR